jgi:hypothetical protein
MGEHPAKQQQGKKQAASRAQSDLLFHQRQRPQRRTGGAFELQRDADERQEMATVAGQFLQMRFLHDVMAAAESVRFGLYALPENRSQ